MGCAICIVSDNSSNGKIKNLWDRASLFEHAPSMRNLRYLPHFTFGIYDELDASVLQNKLINTFTNVSPINVTFDRICCFEASPLVLWASPQKNQQLNEMHEKIHSVIDQKKCTENYRPSRWIPHCTLATDIAASKRDEALEFSSSEISPFEVTFDRIDFINYPPVNIVESRNLLIDN